MSKYALNQKVVSGSFRSVLTVAGLVLVALSGIMLILGATGVFPIEGLAIGSSPGLKTIAAIAVLGCLLAAVGYWDDY
jgi:hypothetical protein